MLKSYEAIYENGEVKWLNEKPKLDSARIIVTVLDNFSQDSQLPTRQTQPLKQHLNKNSQPLRKFGQFRGQIQIADDFDAPLPDEFWLGEN